MSSPAQSPWLNPYTLILIVTSIISAVLNSCQVVVLRRVPKQDASTVLFMSLACTDLIVSVIVLFNAAAYTRIQRIEAGYLTDVAVLIFGITTSIAVTCLITLDRLISVWKPLLRKVSATASVARRLVSFAIVICSCIVVLLVLLEFYTKSINITRFVLSAFLLLTIIFLFTSYVFIVRKFSQNGKKFTSPSHRNLARNSASARVKYSLHHQQQRRLVILSCVICTTFFICSLPYMGFSLYCWNKYFESCKTNNIGMVFIVLNTAINPLVYMGNYWTKKCRSKREEDVLVE